MSMKSYKKIIYSFVAIFGLIAVLGLLATIIVPGIINTEETKAKIETQFKAKTGGEIAYQKVGISLFPLPHASITALQVSMPELLDGKLERADIYPELFPLLTGNVKIKELKVVAPDVTLSIVSQKKPGGESSLDKVLTQVIPQFKVTVDNGRLAMAKGAGEPFHIEKIDALIVSSNGELQYQISCGATAWKRLKIKGSLNPQKLQGNGQAVWEELQPHLLFNAFSLKSPFPVEEALVNLDADFSLAGKDSIEVKLNGSLPNIAIRNDKKKITFRGIQFSGQIQKQADLTTIQLQQFTADFPRGKVSGQFSIDNKTPKIKLALTGEGVQVQAVREIALFFSKDETLVHDVFYTFRSGDIPKVEFSVSGEKFADLILFNNMNGMLSLRAGKVSLAEDEKHQASDLHGDIVIKDGGIALQNVGAQKGRSTISIKTAHITFGNEPYMKIQSGQATLFAEDFQELVFNYGSTGDNLKKQINGVTGQLMLSGIDFMGPLLKPQEWRLNGKGEIKNLVVSTPHIQEPVEITKGAFLAKWDKDGKKSIIEVQETLGIFGKNSISLAGTVENSVAGTELDMQIHADGLDLNLFAKGEEEKETKRNEANMDKFWDIPVSGKLKFTSEYVIYGKYKINAIQTDFLVDAGVVKADLGNVDLCGISLNGSMQADSQSLSLDFKPAVQEQDIEASLLCLFGDRAKVTGTYSFNGEFSSKGAPGGLIGALNGNMNLDVKGGRIYTSPTLATIFSLLSVGDVFKGKLPKFSEEGFSYKYLKSQADVKDGKVIINEIAFESETLNLAGYGEVDVINDKQDLVILVTTLSTVASIIKKIPIIKNIAGEQLLTYPVKVTGSITDPKVRYMSATELGKKAIGIVGRTLMLPVELIKPVTPETDKAE